jgi:type II secretory pathway pseudopilin PulG
MRRGITLLELLVVMLIVLMVTAAAIPVIAPAMQNRQMREATRLVTSFMGAAKARAVQTGRPVGVVIERENGQAFAFRMAQIEVPPPYSGDIINSRATVAAFTPGALSLGRANAITPFQQWFTAAIDPAELNHSLVKVGDTIQFGSQGHFYTVLGPDEPIGVKPIDGVCDNSTLEICYLSPIDFTGKVQFPWLNAAPLPTPQPVTYQIFRQPVRTSSPPLQLPEGIVFDLSVSGGRIMPFNTADYTDPVGTVPVPAPSVKFDPQIIFLPSGRLEFVTDAAGQLSRLTDPVFLLLGRRELMFDVTSRGQASDIVFQNLSPIPSPAGQRPSPAENFWVIVSSNGQVSTAPVAPNFQDYTNSRGGLAIWNDVSSSAVGQSLAFALEQQSLGGR